MDGTNEQNYGRRGRGGKVKKKKKFNNHRFYNRQLEQNPISMPVAIASTSSRSSFYNRHLEQNPISMPVAIASTSSRSSYPNLLNVERERHPAGLRGRDIGLWYKNRSKDRKNERKPGMVMPLTITMERVRRIKSLLDTVSSSTSSTRLNYHISMGLDDKLEDTYPKEYVEMVKVSFQDKLIHDSTLPTKKILLDDMEYNRTLMDEHKRLQTDQKYLKMLEFRRKLPTYKMKTEILNLIHNNQAIVLSGETGCGKSTQVPQLILEEACKDCYGSQINICVTQPRRIAAISLAYRVSSERAEPIGNSIGYAIRLESKPPRHRASITYMTTGVLLRELELSPALLRYSHIILDEVHERDADIDLSLICVKKVMQQRPDLKIILMSATIDAEKLSAFFNNCPYIHIPGLAYPVTDYFLEDVLQVTKFQLPVQNTPTARRGRNFRNFSQTVKKETMHRLDINPYIQTIINKYDSRVIETLKNINSEAIDYRMIVELMKFIITKGEGAILIFLPGIGEISKMLREMEFSGCFSKDYYDIYPLHSKLPTIDQSKIFVPPPKGVRKIVVATNIAETSITIDDVVFVIDCGKIKLTGYNPDDGVSSLMAEWISESNLRQRRGRAGRVQAGECWHLISGYRRSKLLERQLPELLRASLIEPVLTVKRLRLGNAQEVLSEAPDPPDPRSIQRAVKELTDLGALDKEERLTPLGWHLARLPLPPKGGKLLILGALFSCLDPVTSVASSWTFKDPFYSPIGKEREASKAKILLSKGEPSDHFTMHNAISKWESMIDDEPMMANHFVYQNFLSKGTLYQLRDLKKQFGSLLKNMGFVNRPEVADTEVNVNSDNRSLFKALVAAALYPNVANIRLKIKKKRITMTTRLPERHVQVHISSILGNDLSIFESVGSAHYLTYTKKQLTAFDLYVFDVTAVNALPIVFFCNDLVVKPDGPDHYILSALHIKEDLYFLNWRTTRGTTALIRQLRTEFHCLLARHVLHPQPLSDPDDFIVLQALIELITVEDDPDAFPEDDYDDDDDDEDEKPIILDDDEDEKPTILDDDEDEKPTILNDDEDVKPIILDDDVDIRPIILDDDEDKKPIIRGDEDKKPII